MKVSPLLFAFLVLSGCEDTPEFKPFDQYHPLSIKIGKSYVRQLLKGDPRSRFDLQDFAQFDKTFKDIYRVNSENAAIACVERDVVGHLSDEELAEMSKKLQYDSIAQAEFNLPVAGKTIKDLVADCLTPMAKQTYKKINQY